MKVFIVLTERDGETKKVLGETTTRIIRTEKRYAANTIEEVWAAATDEPSVASGEETLIGIYEEHPAITIL